MLLGLLMIPFYIIGFVIITIVTALVVLIVAGAVMSITDSFME